MYFVENTADIDSIRAIDLIRHVGESIDLEGKKDSIGLTAEGERIDLLAPLQWTLNNSILKAVKKRQAKCF